MLKLDGLAAELFGEVSKIPVVDCHQHLPAETERVAQKVDFSTLFSHYTRSDLQTVGLPVGDAEWRSHELFDPSKPVLARWRLFKPYFEAIRYGSYAYSALAYVRDVLGFEDLNDRTVEAVSERLQADNRPGLYSRILEGLCGIRAVLEDRFWDDQLTAEKHFFNLCRSRAWAACHGEGLNLLEKLSGRSISTLASCTEALRARLDALKQRGVVALKIALAYHRDLDFADVPASTAEGIFARLRAGEFRELAWKDRLALSNHLVRREIEVCIDLDLTVAIHTGYQDGLGNDIRNARATLLWPLLRDYPRARFDLFHGSFPYVSDMTVLGKYFPNVSLNMCWMHSISPEVARRALAEWLDAVPVTKIFAFGGDSLVVEKVYGHLQLARADVAAVLAGKVESGRMTVGEALHVAGLLFHENPMRWYKLPASHCKGGRE
jgi:uncharacterized protein